MPRRIGRRGRKLLAYSVLGRRGSFSLFPCFRIRVGGLVRGCGRVFALASHRASDDAGLQPEPRVGEIGL